MIETWKPAFGARGYYDVSDYGRVRRCGDGRLLTPSTPRNTREYPSVMLRLGGVRKRVAIHRLVALTFLSEGYKVGLEVRHLDGNHLNACAGNLAWGTRKDNADDRERHGRTARGDRHGAKGRDFGGTNNPNAKLDDMAVANILKLSRQGYSTRMVAERTGASQRTVWAIVAGKSYCAAALRARAHLPTTEDDNG